MSSTHAIADQRGCHYANGDTRGQRRALSSVEKRFQEFLQQHDPKLCERVKGAFDQWNPILRRHLRDEMGLRLGSDDKNAKVSVHVVPGLPPSLLAVIGQFEEPDWLLLLRKASIDDASATLDGLLSHWRDVEPHLSPAARERGHGATVQVRAMLDELSQAAKKEALLRQFGNIREDVLGAYFFHLRFVNLYWMAIGFIAGVLNLPVEALTVVVAAHELAHAYSHLGKDIDGVRWNTQTFSETELGIVEGLAQYYTEIVCKAIRDRYPTALQAYQGLLKHQSGPYLAHRVWQAEAGATGEAVRIAMIECRQHRVRVYEQFHKILHHHAARLARHSHASSKDELF
jgi:hypothetical protein